MTRLQNGTKLTCMFAAGAFMLGVLVVPESSGALWDVEAAYVIDDVAQDIDLAITGVYTHSIQCDVAWDLVSTTGSSTPSQDHKITLRWSYLRAELQQEDQEDGVITTTLIECDDANLVTVPVGGSGWNQFEVRSPGADHCNYNPLAGDEQLTALSPVVIQDDLRIDMPPVVDGLCLTAAGDTLNGGEEAAFTGIVQHFTIDPIDNLEIRTCDLVVGVCWLNNDEATVDGPADYCPDGGGQCPDAITRCWSRGPLGFLNTVGWYRCQVVTTA